jgi:hypothetical protein
MATGAKKGSIARPREFSRVARAEDTVSGEFKHPKLKAKNL